MEKEKERMFQIQGYIWFLTYNQGQFRFQSVTFFVLILNFAYIYIYVRQENKTRIENYL